MRVVVWIVDGTWQACVDAARDQAPPDAETVLLHVLDEEIAYAAHASFAGLLGTRPPGSRSGAADRRADDEGRT